MLPSINKDKCTYCGDCKDACKENAIVIIPDRLNYVVEDNCSGCKACKLVCPEDAIEETQKEIGFTYQTQFSKDNVEFHLIGGFVKEGFKETSKIVTATKKRRYF